jgi:hypothetical protein
LPAQSQEIQQPQNLEKQLVRHVTLVDEPGWLKEKNKNDDERLPLPNSLIIGIDMNKEALFKLTAAESKHIAAAGTLSRGKNTVALPTDELFRESGSHTYVLQVKAGEIEQEKIFILEVRIESDSSSIFSEMGEGPVKVRNRIYEVSMFVNRKHIASIQKIDTFLSGLLKDALEKPADRAYDPAPLPNSRPLAVGINPLALAAVAYKALKKRIERKKREKTHRIHVKQLSGGFYRKDKDGKKKPLDITVKITFPQTDLKQE